MSLIHAISISRVPFIGLAMVGVFWGAFAALVPDLKAAAEASDKAFGLALIFSAVGGMAATYLVPIVGRVMGRHALPALSVLLSLAVLYPLLAQSVQSLAVALFFMGASMALLDISSNVRISALETRHRLHLMNVNHAMFSLAFGATALGTGVARLQGYGPQEILPVVAGLVFALAIAVFLFEKPQEAPPPDLETGPAQASGGPPWLAIGLTAAVLFAGFIGENAAEAWSALHIERTLGGAPGEGGFGPSMLGFMMAFVRLSGQFVAEKFGEARLIFWSGVLGALGAVIIGAAPTQAVVLIGVAVVGAGMAVVVPSVNSILGRLVREDQRSHAISRAWMFGMLGFFVGPSLMGILSEYFGLRVAFYVIAVIIATMIPAIQMLGREERRRATAPGL